LILAVFLDRLTTALTRGRLLLLTPRPSGAA
jgi:hypothetical protein